MADFKTFIFRSEQQTSRSCDRYTRLGKRAPTKCWCKLATFFLFLFWADNSTPTHQMDKMGDRSRSWALSRQRPFLFYVPGDRRLPRGGMLLCWILQQQAVKCRHKISIIDWKVPEYATYGEIESGYFPPNTKS